MNLLNRIVVILLLLTAMIVAPLALIFPEQTEYSLRYAADLIQINLEWLAIQPPVTQIAIRLTLAAGGLLVFLLCLVLLVMEVIRIRRRTVRLKDGSGELMMDTLANHLSYHIDLLPDVLRVRPRLTSTGKGVRVSLYVETAPNVNMPSKSAEIKETARRVLEEQLGLRVKGEVKVTIKPIPYPRPPRRRRRPTPPKQALATPHKAPQEVEPAQPTSEEQVIEVKVMPTEEESRGEL